MLILKKADNTKYSYTEIGHIDDTAGLADALGKGSVTITISR